MHPTLASSWVPAHPRGGCAGQRAAASRAMCGRCSSPLSAATSPSRNSNGSSLAKSAWTANGLSPLKRSAARRGTSFASTTSSLPARSSGKPLSVCALRWSLRLPRLHHRVAFAKELGESRLGTGGGGNGLVCCEAIGAKRLTGLSGWQRMCCVWLGNFCEVIRPKPSP